MLEIRRLTKCFAGNDRPILDTFSLEIPKGQFVTLIGPSGCGKTTLLRIVAGLLPADSGEVFVAGQESPNPSREKAVVFQHFNLLPWRTSINNVAYGLELQGVSKAQRLKTAREYLALVGLESFANYYPGELSGGMKQRVGIARALAVEPKLLLMDEPFGALDALTREYLQGELQRICDVRHLTVLFVTHSIDEALYLSDRIIVMGINPGRILKEFPVNLERPRWSYNFRADPLYALIRNEIWSLLESELKGSEDMRSRREYERSRHV
ncbi:MAG TPA: ABC transporter ATP-binding protein [Blastocatellia bacterium]|nr:ABC transporter ATP-binding protein [Blastocatellia bacterium]